MQVVLDHLGALPAVAVALLVAVSMFVDASPVVGLLLPGDLLVVTVVASGQPSNAVLVAAGVVAGTLASWSLFFYVGRRIGPRLRHSRLGHWVGPDRWDRAERLLAGRGARALTLVQFLPVLNAVVPMVAGVLGMRYAHFLRFAVPATTLWAGCFSAVGIWAGATSDAVFGESGSPWQLLIFAAPGLVAGWLMVVLLHRGLTTGVLPARESLSGAARTGEPSRAGARRIAA